MTDIRNIQAIIKAIKKTIPTDHSPIGLHEPYLKGNEWSYVKDCLDTGWVSSAGKYVDKFEEMLADYTGVKHAVAVVNGTAALHICLKLSGVESGDEVLMPALAVVASSAIKAYA